MAKFINDPGIKKSFRSEVNNKAVIGGNPTKTKGSASSIPKEFWGTSSRKYGEVSESGNVTYTPKQLQQKYPITYTPPKQKKSEPKPTPKEQIQNVMSEIPRRISSDWKSDKERLQEKIQKQTTTTPIFIKEQRAKTLQEQSKPFKDFRDQSAFTEKKDAKTYESSITSEKITSRERETDKIKYATKMALLGFGESVETVYSAGKFILGNPLKKDIREERKKTIKSAVDISKFIVTEPKATIGIGAQALRSVVTSAKEDPIRTVAYTTGSMAAFGTVGKVIRGMNVKPYYSTAKVTSGTSTTSKFTPKPSTLAKAPKLQSRKGMARLSRSQRKSQSVQSEAYKQILQPTTKKQMRKAGKFTQSLQKYPQQTQYAQPATVYMSNLDIKPTKIKTSGVSIKPTTSKITFAKDIFSKNELQSRVKSYIPPSSKKGSSIIMESIKPAKLGRAGRAKKLHESRQLTKKLRAEAKEIWRADPSRIAPQELTKILQGKDPFSSKTSPIGFQKKSDIQRTKDILETFKQKPFKPYDTTPITTTGKTLVALKSKQPITKTKLTSSKIIQKRPIQTQKIKSGVSLNYKYDIRKQPYDFRLYDASFTESQFSRVSGLATYKPPVTSLSQGKPSLQGITRSYNPIKLKIPKLRQGLSQATALKESSGLSQALAVKQSQGLSQELSLKQSLGLSQALALKQSQGISLEQSQGLSKSLELKQSPGISQSLELKQSLQTELISETKPKPPKPKPPVPFTISSIRPPTPKPQIKIPRIRPPTPKPPTPKPQRRTKFTFPTLNIASKRSIFTPRTIKGYKINFLTNGRTIPSIYKPFRSKREAMSFAGLVSLRSRKFKGFVIEEKETPKEKLRKKLPEWAKFSKSFIKSGNIFREKKRR